MSLENLYTVLSGTGLPVAYGFFPEDTEVSPPCVTYQVSYSSNIGADNKVYSKVNHVDIFLFTTKKDVTNEALIEDALDSASIFYDKTETYESDEKVYQTIYEVVIQ